MAESDSYEDDGLGVSSTVPSSTLLPGDSVVIFCSGSLGLL